MKPFLRQAFIAGLTCILVLVGLCFLPHDRYVRWQAMRTEAYARLGWIYERVHYDQTPIDVAFLGTSHTMNGVDGAAVARGLNANRGGACVTVTNIAMPSYGRNLHWAVARELLTNRKVKLLIIEVFENETRKAHPLFVNVADAKDIVSAPLLININYFNDLARLPFRQASLFAKSLVPAEFGLHGRFDPADYDGSTVDNTYQVNVAGVAQTPPRTQVYPLAKLQAVAKAGAEAKNLNMLGKRFENLEYNFPRHYLSAILDLAKANGTQVRFLYLPAYGKPPAPVDQPLYHGYPMIFANDVLAPPDRWYDDAHLNAAGARALSQRLGEILRDAPELAGVGSSAQCGNGVPPRPSIKPFEKP